jgi:hypothetical protein
MTGRQFFSQDGMARELRIPIERQKHVLVCSLAPIGVLLTHVTQLM